MCFYLDNVWCFGVFAGHNIQSNYLNNLFTRLDRMWGSFYIAFI